MTMPRRILRWGAAVALGTGLTVPAFGDTYEPNDTRETAYGPLVSDVAYTSYIAPGDPADWFTFYAEPGDVSIALTNLPPGTDYDLLLWDANGILDASQEESTTPESISVFITQAQQLWIQVESVSGDDDANPYQLTATFVENTPPVLTLDAPQGGETWVGGTTEFVSWTASDAEDSSAVTLDLDYSLDGGDTWALLAHGLSNTGSYAWTLPDTASLAAVVRARAFDSRPDTTTAMSGPFTLRRPNALPQLALNAPNGGEVWTAGTIENITWTAQDAEDGTDLAIDLAYSADGGETWTDIDHDLDNTGAYAWSLPGEPSETMLVRVRARDSEPDTALALSAAPWTLAPAPNTAPTVSLTYPNGGETFTVGDSIDVTYLTGDAETPDSLTAEIYLSLDNGLSWSPLFAGDADGEHRLGLPLTPSNAAWMRVEVMDPEGAAGADTSDALFTLQLADPETPQVSLGSGSGAYLSQVSLPLTLEHASLRRLSISLTTLSPRLNLDTVEPAGSCPECSLTVTPTALGADLEISTTASGGLPYGPDPLLECTFTVTSAPGDSIPILLDSVTTTDLWDRELTAVVEPGWIKAVGELPTLTLELESTTVSVAETVRVPIHAQWTVPADSVAVTLDFDPLILRWEGVEAGTTGWTADAVASGDSVRLFWTGGTAPAEGGVLGTLVFTALAGPQAALSWRRAHAWGPGGVSLPVEAGDGMVTPVRVLSFTAQSSETGTELAWTLAAADPLTRAQVWREGPGGVHPLGGWVPAGLGHMVDTGAIPGKTYTYRLMLQLRDGSRLASSEVRITLPYALSLNAPYPNPGSGPVQALYRGDLRTAAIYDLQGRLVRRLEVPEAGAGVLTWDGRIRSGAAAAPGIYFLRVTGPRGSRVQRMVRTP